MASGMYMNEIVRQALVYIGGKNLFCSSELYEAIKEPFSFAPKIISTLEEDAESGHCILCKPVKKYYRQKSTMEMLKNELLGKSTDSKIKIQDFHIIREVCQAITERGARLVGIAIGCLAQRIDRKKVVFGIDGTHYQKTLTYKKLIPLQIKTIVPDKEVKLVSVEDGSLKGAAFLAATLNEQ